MNASDTTPTNTSSLDSPKITAEQSECSGKVKRHGERTKSNQRWMKLRTTVQISSAVQKKPPLKREDSFLKRFSTRQPEAHETTEDVDSGDSFDKKNRVTEKRNIFLKKRQTVVNPDEKFYFNWLMVQTGCVLYNFWTLIVRESFPELQERFIRLWTVCDAISDFVYVLDIVIQLRTGYLEQGLMVYDDKKLAMHYLMSRTFLLDIASLLPLDLLQWKLGQHPLLRFPRFFKVYRTMKFYYIVESRTVWPNLWRVINLIHILLILAHWFGCFYYLLSEAEDFVGDWVYPYRPGEYATLTRKYLGSLYWSTLTLTTIGDLPTPETNVEHSDSADGPRSLPRRGLNSRLLRVTSSFGFIFTILSYLIGVFIFATIVGQVGNVITNRNANRLEFERLLDGAKTYMRHHRVPGDMKRRVLRWYDYSWSRGRIQGGGDINKALGLLPDKLKTELALHVNLTVLKKVTIFQECQPEFLHDLVLKMKAYIFTPGDSICRRGEVAREMFIIADGILEVLSETGKVLTTMKAGDFFGEIGILNLDGFNKRTADVRSVGYSELFSLSRDDVLAAMKDYPEAEEILQDFGRKRLMEIKRINKRSQKHAGVKDSLNRGQSDNAENATKNFVKKIKTDIKGIISSRKLRKSGPSNESLELEPLRQKTTKQRSKGFLQRSQRVNSNDLPTSDNQFGEKIKTTDLNSPDQISHHKLCDLKEGKILSVEVGQSRKSSGQNDADTSSPEKSTEVVGAGLSLIQRILLLKAKNEQEALRKAAAQETISSPPPAASATKAIEVASPPGSTSSITHPKEFQFKAEVTNSNLQVEEEEKNPTAVATTTSTEPIEKTTPKYSFKKILLSEKQVKTKSPILATPRNVQAQQDEQKMPNVEKPPVTIISETAQQITANWKSRYQKYVKNLQPKHTWLPLIDEVANKTNKMRSLSLDTFSQVNSNNTRPSHTKAAFRRHSDTTSFFLQKIDSKHRSSRDIRREIIETRVTPISSPEMNETTERKQLKSILKKMGRSERDATDETTPCQLRKIRQLIREPTTEGYVARHSTLMKSVTFTSACSSPDVIGRIVDSSENLPQGKSNSPLSEVGAAAAVAAAVNVSDSSCLEHQWNQSIEKCDTHSFLCNCQMLTGFDEEAYLNDVTLNVRKVIQSFTCDLQDKFQNRINFLESEIRRRDAIIERMQKIIDQAEIYATKQAEIEIVSWKHLTEGNTGATLSTASHNSTITNQEKYLQNRWKSRKYDDDSLEDSSDDQDSERNWKASAGYRILKASLDGTLRSTSSLTSENSIQSIGGGHYDSQLPQNDDAYDSQQMCVVELEHNKILTCGGGTGAGETIFDSDIKDQGTKSTSYDTTTITTTTTTTTTSTIDENRDNLTIRQSTTTNTDQS